MKVKKLKDLRKGDSVWLDNIADTTPITVTSVKHTGMMVEIKVQWDDSEYICYGHAFNTRFTGYAGKYYANRVFTTSYNDAKSNEMYEQTMREYASIGRDIKSIVKSLKILL